MYGVGGGPVEFAFAEVEREADGGEAVLEEVEDPAYGIGWADDGAIVEVPGV